MSLFGDELQSTGSGAGIGAAFGGVGAPIGAGVGALAGLINHFAFQKPAENRARTLAAATQRYSPWTKLQAQAPEASNPMSSALGLASAGAQFGQNLNQASQQNALQNAWMNYMNRSPAGAPSGGAAPMDTFAQENNIPSAGSLQAPSFMPNSYDLQMPGLGSSSAPADPTYGGWLSGRR